MFEWQCFILFPHFLLLSINTVTFQSYFCPSTEVSICFICLYDGSLSLLVTTDAKFHAILAVCLLFCVFSCVQLLWNYKLNSLQTQNLNLGQEKFASLQYQRQVVKERVLWLFNDLKEKITSVDQTSHEGGTRDSATLLLLAFTHVLVQRQTKGGAGGR